jgi:hypothetical protein
MSRPGPSAVRTAVLAALLAAPLPPAPAQGPGGVPLPPNNQQTELFRGLFHFHKIEPESTANLTRGYDYSDLIVVVYGNPRVNSPIPGIAKTALRNGGAVLIANSGETDLNPYLPSNGASSITGRRVQFLTQPSPNVKSWASRGGVVPIPQLGGAGPEGELFAPYQRVEVASASYLVNDARPPEFAVNVAAFPPNAQAGANVRPPLLFAAAGVGSPNKSSRCVVLADQSVFSNQMIYTSGRVQDPTDNLKFANTLVQWLKGPEGRTRCLFVENGTVQTKFDDVQYAAIPTGPPMPPVPVPPLPNPRDRQFQENLTNALNRGIEKAQEDDRLGKFLASNNERKASLYLWLAAILAFVLYVLVRFRTLAARFQAVFRPVPKDPLRLGPDTVVGSVEHRRLELLRAGDYSVPVRAYIRQLFVERGLPPDHRGDRPPRFRFDLRNRDFVRQALTTLWAELHSDKPITYARWKELEPLLAAAVAAADDDRWWIGTPDEGRA